MIDVYLLILMTIDDAITAAWRFFARAWEGL